MNVQILMDDSLDMVICLHPKETHVIAVFVSMAKQKNAFSCNAPNQPVKNLNVYLELVVNINVLEVGLGSFTFSNMTALLKT